MDNSTLLVSTVLVSTVLAGLVAALVSLRTSERAIKIENVTKERAKWREKVREKALDLHRACVKSDRERVSELHLEFSLILNPDDPEDREILLVLDAVAESAPDSTKLKELGVRLALLLKHDWERAKIEAEPFWWRLLRWRFQARRISYDEWRLDNARKRP
jgi:hypothetical protein